MCGIVVVFQLGLMGYLVAKSKKNRLSESCFGETILMPPKFDGIVSQVYTSLFGISENENSNFNLFYPVLGLDVIIGPQSQAQSAWSLSKWGCRFAALGVKSMTPPTPPAHVCALCSIRLMPKPAVDTTVSGFSPPK